MCNNWRVTEIHLIQDLTVWWCWEWLFVAGWMLQHCAARWGDCSRKRLCRWWVFVKWLHTCFCVVGYISSVTMNWGLCGPYAQPDHASKTNSARSISVCVLWAFFLLHLEHCTFCPFWFWSSLPPHPHCVSVGLWSYDERERDWLFYFYFVWQPKAGLM